MTSKYQLDKLDLQIIQHMMNDAKISYADLGKNLFVSGGTIHVRIKKLQDSGIIKGSKLNIDMPRLGYEISAFVGIIIDNSLLSDEVANRLKNIPEIVRLNYTTGHYNLLAEVQCRSIAELQEILHYKIESIEGIKRTETLISLKEDFKRSVQVIEPG